MRHSMGVPRNKYDPNVLPYVLQTQASVRCCGTAPSSRPYSLHTSGSRLTNLNTQTTPPGGGMRGSVLCQPTRRQLWGMLNAVFNKPDSSRIKEVGAHRACAEWLLRCGAHVRWQGMPSFQDDYNKLPSGGFQKFKIEEINADNAAIMAVGFPHFDGVDTVKKFRFHHCTYLYDEAMTGLVRLKDSLEDLEISGCGDITDEGLEAVTQLTKLKRLVLYDLPAVRNKEATLHKLQAALPNCEIDFKDLQKDKPA